MSNFNSSSFDPAMNSDPMDYSWQMDLSFPSIEWSSEDTELLKAYNEEMTNEISYSEIPDGIHTTIFEQDYDPNNLDPTSPEIFANFVPNNLNSAGPETFAKTTIFEEDYILNSTDITNGPAQTSLTENNLATENYPEIRELEDKYRNLEEKYKNLDQNFQDLQMKLNTHYELDEKRRQNIKEYVEQGKLMDLTNNRLLGQHIIRALQNHSLNADLSQRMADLETEQKIVLTKLNKLLAPVVIEKE